MGENGDLLELLHGASGRWTTVRATVRSWRHTARSAQAMARWEKTSRATQYVRFTREGETPETSEHRERLWIAKPDRYRQEHELGHVSVGRGRLWWSYSPHHGYVTNENDPETGHGDPLGSHAAHLAPAHLIPRIDVESIERRQDVLVVRVRPRDEAFFGPGLPPGADAHVLTVDPVRGVVLRVESLVDGEPFAVSELEDAVFDEELDDAIFTLEVPPGEQALSPHEMHPRLTLEEAVERCGFTIFVVAELPDGAWRLDVRYQPPRREMAESVGLLYHRSDGRGSLHLTERAAGGSNAWARMAGSAHVEVERDGTAVELSSTDLDEATLEGLASALAPA